MTGQPVLGEFLGRAGEHITAAVAFRSELSRSSTCDIVRQLDRLVMAIGRCLADLPDPPYGPEGDAVTLLATPRLALGRATESLRQDGAVLAGTGAGDPHPAAAHLTAAADCLNASHDLLNTHFSYDGSTRRAASFWAPVLSSRPVTSALLDELATHTQSLASWVGRHTARHANPRPPSTARQALTAATPWLELAATTMHATRQAHYPLPARAMLDAIPASIPPPQQPPAGSESVPDLCQSIPVTAERLRHAAFAFASQARWSPAATSLSWRRDALACAITSHSSELILSALAKRADQLSLEPAFQQQMQAAAESMAKAWQSWRAVAGQWDILTTGAPRGCGLTPVAAEAGELAVRVGRLAHASPQWTPARSHASTIREPADLAPSAADIRGVLAAVHHAADAMHHIASTDHQAATNTADDGRLYIPVRLLSDKYDIPQPYTTAPRSKTVALLTAYNTAVTTAKRAAAALDNLAEAISSPTNVLAATRQVSPGAWHDHRQPHHRPIPEPPTATPLPGRTEQALLKLQIRDPALLLRAAAIDQAAHDLISEATAVTRSRASVTRLQALRNRNDAQPPSQLAGQDIAPIRRTGSTIDRPHRALTNQSPRLAGARKSSVSPGP